MRIINDQATPVDTIQGQLQELRPLPTGLDEFEEWSDRIIAGAMLKGNHDQEEAFVTAQKYTLANILLHLPPTKCFESDVYFIHSLRKFAVNEVADFYRKQVYAKRKALEDSQQAKADPCLDASGQ